MPTREGTFVPRTSRPSDRDVIRRRLRLVVPAIVRGDEDPGAASAALILGALRDAARTGPDLPPLS